VAAATSKHYGPCSASTPRGAAGVSRKFRIWRGSGFNSSSVLPRGVKLSPAGKLFLKSLAYPSGRKRSSCDAPPAWLAVNQGRCASGSRECRSWRGVVPESSTVPGDSPDRRTPTSAVAQFGAVRSDPVRPFGCRVRTRHAKADPELERLQSRYNVIELAVPTDIL